MKKYLSLIFAIILALALCACGEISSDSRADEQTPTQPDEVVSASNEQDDLKDEVVFYEDDILKATFLNVSEQVGLDGVGYIGVIFENKSDAEITVLPMDSAVNDTAVMYFSGIPATMQGGKTLNFAWGFYFDKAGITSIDEIENLEFSLEIDDEFMNQLVRTDIITIEVD